MQSAAGVASAPVLVELAVAPSLSIRQISVMSWLWDDASSGLAGHDEMQSSGCRGVERSQLLLAGAGLGEQVLAGFSDLQQEGVSWAEARRRFRAGVICSARQAEAKEGLSAMGLSGQR